MDAVLNMEQENREMVRQMAQEFAEKHIKPYVMEWDESQHFPVDTFKAMGELGMMGVFVPEEWGGSGLGYHEYVDVIVETAKVCGAVGLSVAAHNSLCTGHIPAFAMSDPVFGSVDYIVIPLGHRCRHHPHGIRTGIGFRQSPSADPFRACQLG